MASVVTRTLCSLLVAPRRSALSRHWRCRRSAGTIFVVDSDESFQAPSNARRVAMFAEATKQRSKGAGGEATAVPSKSPAAPDQHFRQGKDPWGSGRYAIPTPYNELLDRRPSPPSREVQARSSEEATADERHDEANSERDSEREWVRDFWRQARGVAKHRLEALGPDPGPVQRKSARYHESLWAEELGVTLELRRWRTTAEVLPCIGEGLYQLNVGEIHDQKETSTNEQGLLRGVRILIRSSNGDEFGASVQPGSGSGTLLLSASPSLEFSEGPFDIEFHPHRFTQLAMHRALDSVQAELVLAETLESASPSDSAVSSTASAEALRALPASLNDVQRRAVAACLEPGPQTPLVIWGPPGTGKSTLAAFIVWHLVQQRPTGLHILLAAPSNTGADVLCAKLARLGLDDTRMLRLNALGRSFATVPEELRRYCHTTVGEDGRPVFKTPSVPELRSFKVVVTTCICASHVANALRREGAQGGWFSHVLVDEAGEATEPETLVPLSLLRPVAGRMILLGDHFQLGPLVISSLAQKLARLDESMIERLANERFRAARSSEGRSALNRDTLLECESRGLFFLTESFRSHPAIMAMYSEVFYAGQLEHRPRPQQQRLLPYFESQGCTQGPVILHNIVGTERRDPGSASPYNIDEVRIVQRYVMELLASRRPEGDGKQPALEPKDIGIITPYARQVQALKRQLASLGPAYAGIEVGTVEHFQGQERRAVILSTVRSSMAQGLEGSSPVESRRPIGFLADPRRLNVAVSRAVAGLVIVGDLGNLSKYSSDWRALLGMGQDAGFLRGDPLDFSPPDLPPLEVDAKDAKPAQAVPAAEASAAWDALTDD